MGMGMVMGLRGKGKNSPATKILTNPWAVMRVGGSWSSSCVSDAPTLRFHSVAPSLPPVAASSHRRRPTDGRDRCMALRSRCGTGFGPAARSSTSTSTQQEQEQENYVSAGQELKHGLPSQA